MSAVWTFLKIKPLLPDQMPGQSGNLQQISPQFWGRESGLISKASRHMDVPGRAVMDDAFCVFVFNPLSLPGHQAIQATCFFSQHITPLTRPDIKPFSNA